MSIKDPVAFYHKSKGHRTWLNVVFSNGITRGGSCLLKSIFCGEPLHTPLLHGSRSAVCSAASPASISKLHWIQETTNGKGIHTGRTGYGECTSSSNQPNRVREEIFYNLDHIILLHLHGKGDPPFKVGPVLGSPDSIASVESHYQAAGGEECT